MSQDQHDDSVRNLDLAQYFTPKRLAQKIFDEHFCPGAGHVIDPCAGSGDLLAPWYSKYHQAHHLGISAVEVDPLLVQEMRALFPSLKVEHHDYLSLKMPRRMQPVTVLMNPPDAREKGIMVVDFLEKALMDAGENGRVIALVRTNALHGISRAARVWNHAHISSISYLAHRPRFEGPGGQQEWCVVVYEQWSRNKRASTRVNHWMEKWGGSRVKRVG